MDGYESINGCRRQHKHCNIISGTTTLHSPTHSANLQTKPNQPTTPPHPHTPKQTPTHPQLEVGGPFALWSQAQTTYAKLKQDEHGEWQIQVLKQKIWVKGVSYELQEIYGMEAANRKHHSSTEASGGPSGAAGVSYDELEGGECVICMSSDRDTMVLPCRHMCMCQECAAALKTQTSKCPICR